MDTVDKETRSKIMSKVGQKATAPEMKLRKALFARGFRYRVNVKKLSGSPDLVFKKYKAAIFVHGCFWHRHEGCKYATIPKSRVEFWSAKFKANIERDKQNIQKLIESGWRVLVIWECVIKKKDEKSFRKVVDEVERWLYTHEVFKEMPSSRSI